MKYSLVWELVGIIILSLAALFMFKGDELICVMAKSEVYAYEQCTNDPDCYMNYPDYRDFHGSETLMELHCD